MVILHDAVKTVQNLGFLFFPKKRQNKKNLVPLRKTKVFINLYYESHTTMLTVAFELAKTLQLSDFNGFQKGHKPCIKI